MVTQLQNALSILRRNQVIARTGLSRSTIYQKIKDGEFPKQISLGARAVGWTSISIDEWIDAQIQKSRTA